MVRRPLDEHDIYGEQLQIGDFVGPRPAVANGKGNALHVGAIGQVIKIRNGSIRVREIYHDSLLTSQWGRARHILTEWQAPSRTWIIVQSKNDISWWLKDEKYR